MGVSSSPAEAARKVAQIGQRLDDVSLAAGRKAGAYGKALYIAEARDRFGADRRPSRWVRGRRTVNARQVVRQNAGKVTGKIYPTGAPYYVFARGRPGGTTILPGRRSQALATPFGPRARVVQGAQPAEPELVDRPQRLFARRLPELYQSEVRELLRRTLR